MNKIEETIGAAAMGQVLPRVGQHAVVTGAGSSNSMATA